jgi:hypothetical protein
MRAIKAHVATALGLTFFATALCADDYPARKPGLWEVAIQSGNIPAHTIKMCIDAETDQLFHKMGTDLRTMKHCAQDTVTVTGSTVNSVTQCKVHNETISTTAVTTFTGDSAYHSDIKSHIDPPILGKSDTTLTQDGKWTGDCPADMKPGDMVLASGIKFNVKTLNFIKSLIPGQ